MMRLLERYLPLHAPEDGGGAGAAGAGAASAAGGSGAGDGQAAGGANGGQAAGAAGGAGEGAGGAGGAGDGGKPYFPEGIRDDFKGANDRETIDRMHKALDGYRQRDASKGVPETPDAYATFDTDKLVADMKLDAAVVPHLKELAGDPIMKEVGAFALEHKVPGNVVQGIVATAYAAAQKAGILEAPVDAAAERAALLPESAAGLPKAQQDAAIDARMQENEEFIKLLSQPGADGKPQLDPKVGEHALLMLMDSASGNRFLEFMRANMTGAGRAQPQGGQGSGQGRSASEALLARERLPENTPGHRLFNRASWDQLQEDYRKTIGE